MKSVYLTILGLGMLLGFAQPITARQAEMCTLRPFTAHTQYMSLPGYYRWLHFQQQQAWLTTEQAVAGTREELRTCSVK